MQYLPTTPKEYLRARVEGHLRADGLAIERKVSTNWQGRDGRTILLLAWMGSFRDSNAGWHIHGDGLRMLGWDVEQSCSRAE